MKRTVAGDRRAGTALVDRLLPVIQRRVGWVLSRRRPTASREDALDYTQDVLLRLFEQDFRILKTWDAERGASLATFVGLVAERDVISTLRSGRKSGWKEDPTLDVDLDRKVEAPGIEERLWSREVLERLLDRVEEELNPRARSLFEAFYLEELPAEEIATRFDMSLNALYTWRSRFKSKLETWAEEVS